MGSIKYKLSGEFIKEDGEKFKVNSQNFSANLKPKELREEAIKEFQMWKQFLEESNDINVTFEKQINFDGKEISLKYGIGLYAEINDEEFLIDFFGSYYLTTYDSIALGLKLEYEFYENEGLEMPEIFHSEYCSIEDYVEGYVEDAMMDFYHFFTSADLSGKKEPYWWMDNERKYKLLIDLLRENMEIDSEEDIIKEGENQFREFKPSLLYNFKSGEGSISMKYLNAKSICAFLNSKGGKLYIGISDKEGIQGLEISDFKLAGDKDPKDFVRLEFDQMIRHFFKPVVRSFITGDFEEIDGKLVFVVTISVSDQPIFLRNTYNEIVRKEFYVQTSASSMPIIDVEEIVEYCFTHWG